jgi:CBS domain-containing protein
MTKKVISISPESYIDDAVYIMIQHKIKKLPVVNNGELVGILTSSDILTNSEDIGQFYIFD